MPFTAGTLTSIRGLSLWNGSSNNAVPAGWHLPSFDDAAWPSATAANTAPGEIPAGGPLPVWTSADPRSATEQALFRGHITVPTDIVSVTMAVCADDDAPEVYLNGVLLAVPVTTEFAALQNWGCPVAAWLQGQSNLLAIRGANLFGGAAYIAFGLSIETLDDTNTGNADVTANTGTYGAYLGPTTDYSGDAWHMKHNSGVLDVEHDGALFRVRSHDRTVLQTPFPTMNGQAAALLGRDPQTGLPMWTGGTTAPPPPAPPLVSHTYSQPDRSLEDTHGAPIPLPVPPNAQRVCGAAEAMAKLACVLYDAIVQVINKAKSDIISDFTQGLKAEISAELVSLLTEAEFAQWAIDAVQLALTILAQIVQTLLNWGTSLPMIWPPNPLGHPTSQQYLFLRCAAWQALWLTGGDYLSRAKSADGLGTKDYWAQYLAPQWSFFAGSTQSGISQANPPWQLVWINAVIDKVADVGWAYAASKGAQEPSTGCTGCTGYPP